jgi:hypothetical protein
MEGQGTIESQDQLVDSRFKVMQSVTCSNLNRTKGNWYDAVPPLCRCWSGLSPADYFGRTMVEYLPEEIRVGVINVSVAGCKIELFDKDNYQDYASGVESWMTNIINEYGGNPYAHLIELAQQAKQDGVIKGILMHQGESNTGDNQWPAKVKGVYNNLISDLELNPDSVPLLAGEVVHANQGGICASMNTIIAKLPESIPNSHVISSDGCTDAADNLHFNSEGYRKLGRRYAAKMLSLLGYDVDVPDEPDEPSAEGTESFFFEPECVEDIGQNWKIEAEAGISNGYYITVTPGIESLTSAAEEDGTVSIPFITTTDSTYYIYGLMNCPSADDDSYWVTVDDEYFVMCNGLATSGWQWITLNSYNLAAGEHTFRLTYREDGAKLDKLCISNYSVAPKGLGEEAEKQCNPVSSATKINFNGFSLAQNIPNPAGRKTVISFEIPEKMNVSLKIYDINGKEIYELAGKEYRQGKHNIEFYTDNFKRGIYFYTLKAGCFTSTRKLTLNN